LSRALGCWLLSCALLAPLPSRAQPAMDLPPVEDRAAWMEAWREVSQGGAEGKVVPRLAISSGAEGWQLSVWDSQGALRTVAIQAPASHADRVDLLFLAISMAQPRDDWGWSAIQGAEPPATEPEGEEEDAATEPPPSAAQTGPRPAPTPSPTRSFVSASGASSRSPPLPAEPAVPPLLSAGVEPLAPSPSSSAPAPDAPDPEPLDPLFPEPREPIPILDEPQQGPLPGWAWLQLDLGPCWRPQTSPAWEGSLRGGFTGEAARLAVGVRASTPSELTAFHPQAERSAWELDWLAGPWVSLGPWLEAGLEGGVALRRYRQGDRLHARDTLPMVSLELVGRRPWRSLLLGPYLRGVVDLDSTSLANGAGDPNPDALPLWTLSAGLQVAALGAGRTRTTGE
jgi:hypothetical protein